VSHDPHQGVVGAPSDWIARWTPLLAPGSSVLDVACGSGRHARWLARAGHRVTAIDRDPEALAVVALEASEPGIGIRTLLADLEAAPWPLPGERFDAVVVTHYLWRPLLPTLLAAVAPGGLLLYETFALGQAALGRPRNPDFLLRPNELIDLLRAPPQPAAPSAPAADPPSPAWHVIAFEEGRLAGTDAAPPREVQRIVARRGKSPPERPDRLFRAG
jgi:SAM-dependent methyltransferase